MKKIDTIELRNRIINFQNKVCNWTHNLKDNVYFWTFVGSVLFLFIDSLDRSPNYDETMVQRLTVGVHSIRSLSKDGEAEIVDRIIGIVIFCIAGLISARFIDAKDWKQGLIAGLGSLTILTTLYEKSTNFSDPSVSIEAHAAGQSKVIPQKFQYPRTNLSLIYQFHPTEITENRLTTRFCMNFFLQKDEDSKADARVFVRLYTIPGEKNRDITIRLDDSQLFSVPFGGRKSIGASIDHAIGTSIQYEVTISSDGYQPLYFNGLLPSSFSKGNVNIHAKLIGKYDVLGNFISNLFLPNLQRKVDSEKPKCLTEDDQAKQEYFTGGFEAY